MKTLLNFCLIGILSACAAVPTSRSPAVSRHIPSNNTVSAYWTAQPFCSGRYQISLPANRIAGTGWIRYNDWQVIVQPDYWVDRVRTISKIQRERKDGSKLFIENRTLIPGKAIVTVTRSPGDWEDPLILRVNGVLYHADLSFKLGKNDAYIVSGLFRIMPVNGKEPPNLKQLEKDKIDEIIGHYRNHFLNNLQSRADHEIPQKPGICLTEGFIGDSGNEPFFGSAGIKIKDYTDVYAELTTGGSLDQEDKPLLKRDIATNGSMLSKMMSWAKYSTIRKGSRTINGMSGSEKLVKWQGNRYLFVWEKDDGSVNFTMMFGTSGSNKAGSPLSEREALAAWDAILPTLKKRI
ncbi:T6SS immunity protein Tli4 family protein [Neisseria zoodegmatis]|nr:T6SS immunity protein Tli4 family protein [Neisseria zoodegmatis]